MRRPFWLTDTIARRFALIEILATLVTVALVLLFNSLGGTWAAEPLSKSNLLSEVAATVRIIEAAPPATRPSLAAAAGNSLNRVFWFAADSDAARFLRVQGNPERDEAQEVSRTVLHESKLMHVTSSRAMPETLRLGPTGTSEYVLAVALRDGSWTVFATANRQWGPSIPARWLIRVFFLCVSVSLITAIAAKQFARPIDRLVRAVHEFGRNPQAPAIPEAGPRELRKVIQTFNEMRAQIQKLLSHRTMMLAAISHDLRTPLTRMRLRGELIEDPEQQARHFRDVDEMEAMVEGALAFFRDDAATESMTTFDLPQLLMTIVNDYADQKIEITYQGPAHANYNGRVLALRRAIGNLVDNAVKYATPPAIELRVEAGAFVILIQDQGPGIPEPALGKVFFPYYRLERSRNRATGGVGLGLTVVQAIVQGHGGEVVLGNLPGGGLEARVILPIIATRAAMVASRQA